MIQQALFPSQEEFELSENDSVGYINEMAKLDYFTERLSKSRFDIFGNPKDPKLWKNVRGNEEGTKGSSDLIIVDHLAKIVYLVEIKKILHWNINPDWIKTRVIARFCREKRHLQYAGYKIRYVLLSDGRLKMTREAYESLDNARIKLYTDHRYLYFNILKYKNHSDAVNVELDSVDVRLVRCVNGCVFNVGGVFRVSVLSEFN